LFPSKPIKTEKGDAFIVKEVESDYFDAYFVKE